MATKVTFTLDEVTIEKLGITAERLRKPKSQVVREAIAEYHDRAGKLSEEERRRLLGALDQMPGAWARDRSGDRRCRDHSRRRTLDGEPRGRGPVR